MELASNLVWLIAALSLIGLTYRGVRTGYVRLTMLSAMTLALLLCFILLPVISVSDDFLAMRQATLPESEQIWRMASHDASVGLLVLALAASLWSLLASQIESRHNLRESRVLRPLAAQLVRLQRLRPPPQLAL